MKKRTAPQVGLASDSKRLYIAAAVVIVLLAAAIRICGIFNDLWLDEIWSLYLAREISSPVEVFTKIHHDNNHYLTTLYMYLVGPHGNWPGYRIPSLVAGVGAVVVAGLIGRRRNTASAIFAMLLVGFSYVLTLYSSEARGYASAVFFALLSFYLLDRYLETTRWPLGLMSSLTTVCGILSQLVFLDYYAAALVWSAYQLLRSRARWKQTILAAVLCHALPVLCCVIIYLVDVRHMQIGGGTATTLSAACVSVLAWSVGSPLAPYLTALTSTVVLIILVVGLWWLWRKRTDWFMFFLGAILVFPVLLVVVHNSDVLYVRHFIIGMVFFLILCSFLLAELYRQGLPGQTLCMLLLLGYFAANGRQMACLAQYGRGHPFEAIRFMEEHSDSWPVTIGSDHDFRVGSVVEFYIATTSRQADIKYCFENSRLLQGPEWGIICQTASLKAPVSRGTLLTDGAGNEYEFVKAFPSAPLSGPPWFVYHNRASKKNLGH
jgi:hypothetical protein